MYVTSKWNVVEFLKNLAWCVYIKWIHMIKVDIITSYKCRLNICVCSKITNCMVQSPPWAVDIQMDKIFPTFIEVEGPYCVLRNSPFDRLQSHLDIVHMFTICAANIHFNINIHSGHLNYSSLAYVFIRYFPHACWLSNQFNDSLFNHPYSIKWR